MADDAIYGRPASSRSRRARAGVLIALAVVAGFAAWIARERRVWRDARAVRRGVAAERLAEAEAPLDRWLRARPRSAEARYFKARIDLARGRFNRALEALAVARSLGYPEPEVARLLGIILARNGQGAAARPILRRTLGSTSRPEPEVARELARIELEGYWLDAAEAALQRWIRDSPGQAAPYLWWTEIDRRRRVHPEVLLDHYRTALRLDPGLDAARLGLANALREAGRNDEAETVYAAYLSRHPDDARALLGAGLNASASGEPEKARALLHRAAELNPSDYRAGAELAALAMRRGDDQCAAAWLDEAIRLAPQEVSLRHHRALVLNRLGRPEEADRDRAEADRLRREQGRISKLRDRLGKSPNDVGLRHEVARWMIENGHDEEGLRWCRAILSEHPGHAPTHRLLAEYHARRGEAGLANYHRLRGAAGQ